MLLAQLDNIKNFVMNEKKASIIMDKIKSAASSDIYQIARDFNSSGYEPDTYFRPPNIPGLEVNSGNR
jgi:hypothetical protein